MRFYNSIFKFLRFGQLRRKKGLLWRRVLPALLAFAFVLGQAQTSTAAQRRSQNSDESRYLQQLSEADRFYEAGNIQQSLRIRTEIKPKFSASGVTTSAPPILDPTSERLAPAAQIYWRDALDGIEKQLNLKAFVSLQMMTDNYPDFLPAHLKLAELCESEPKECRDQARAKQPKDAVEVLERVGNLYPKNTDIIDRKLALFDRVAERNETKNAFFVKLLDASISARQFALAYPDDPASERYRKLADDYMKRYQSKLKEMITIYAGFGVLLGSSESAMQLATLAQGENAYGARMLENYKKKHKFIEDPSVNKYVSEIGNKIAKQAGREDLNFKFYVDENPSPGAEAYPGGIIIVHSGMLQQARTESELAGVISHEIAHCALSHYYTKQAELGLMQAFSRILPLGTIFRDLTDQDFKYRQEYEADILGTRILAKSGYSADGLWSYLTAIRQVSSNSWSSSHPSPASRIAGLETLIESNNYNRYAYEGVARQQTIQAKVDQLLEGKVIAQGSVGSGNAFVDDATAQPVKRSSQPSPKKDQLTRSASGRVQGEVPLNITQERYGVTVRLEKAYVSSFGTYVIEATIVNGSDQPFGFVPVFSEVLDQSGKTVTSRYDFSGSADGIMVKPGESLTGKINLPSRKWISGDQQGIIVVLTEGSSGGRVFRIGL
jgi:Zn-dependent protease with chaperone function